MIILEFVQLVPTRITTASIRKIDDGKNSEEKKNFNTVAATQYANGKERETQRKNAKMI